MTAADPENRPQWSTVHQVLSEDATLFLPNPATKVQVQNVEEAQHDYENVEETGNIDYENVDARKVGFGKGDTRNANTKGGVGYINLN